MSSAVARHPPPPPPPPPKGGPPKPAKKKSTLPPADSRIAESSTDDYQHYNNSISSSQVDEHETELPKGAIDSTPTKTVATAATTEIKKEQNPSERNQRAWQSSSSTSSINNPFDDEVEVSRYASAPSLSTSSDSIPTQINPVASIDTEGGIQRRGWMTTGRDSEKKESDSFRSAGEPSNPIYHKIRLSESWLVFALLVFIGQFVLLLVVGSGNPPALPSAVLGVLLLIIVVASVLIVLSRYLVQKSRLSDTRNIKLRGGVCTPEDEADEVLLLPHGQIKS